MIGFGIRSVAAVSTLALMLAACGDAEVEDIDYDTELETPTTDGEAAALADAIEPGDFADLTLGAKIEGPQGPEVTGMMANAKGGWADIRSYVTCPARMETCDPKTAPEGTIFTYVHVVIPGTDNDADTGDREGPDNNHVESAESFAMTSPAHGFTGNAGYSKAEPLAAMGQGGQVVVTCEDGKLTWTIDAGDGGDQWEHKEPITFWWQSTVPPAGPSEAYQIRADGGAANGTGPYPSNKAGATNACLTGDAPAE